MQKLDESALVPSPCFAVIFVSKRLPGDDGYGDAAARMQELGATQPGFLGIRSVRAADGQGITVVFYDSPDAASAWGRNPEHRDVQRQGRDRWYESYEIYYTKVERSRGFVKQSAAS